MDTIGLIKKGLIITTVSSLIACGGGGGGSDDPTYTGKTSPAKITADNASELTGAAVGGSGPASTTASLTGEPSDQEKKKVAGFARGLRGAARSALREYQGGSSSAIGAVVQVDEPIEGECGGTAVATGTIDDEVFDVDLTITFKDYCDDGAIFNGVIGMKGTDDGDNSNVTMTFTNLDYKSKTESLTINGTIASKGTDVNYTVSMTYDFRDNNAGKTYRAENLVIVIYEPIFADYLTATISGKIYHPDYGSFTISTDPELVIDHAKGYPTSGTIRMDGAEASSAAATYRSDGKYTLVINDGTTETTQLCDSLTDVCEDITPK